MAGSYCKFCDNRCFVERVIPDGPSAGWRGHMATCTAGMAHDRAVTGHTHQTATNPYATPGPLGPKRGYATIDPFEAVAFDADRAAQDLPPWRGVGAGGERFYLDSEVASG